MIKVEITAEQWNIAEALYDLSVDMYANDILDELYDGTSEPKTIERENYTVTITFDEN